MTHCAIVPAKMRDAYETMKFSPGVISGDHLFLTGMTGAAADGTMPVDAATQMRNAFDKIEYVLAEAGSKFDDIVEMTTYHIGLRDHFDLFDAIRLEYVRAPYPAWTAIEAAGLRRIDAIVEIRIIARKGSVV